MKPIVCLLLLVLSAPLGAAATLTEVTASLNSLVTNANAREFALCHLRAGIWGDYDVTVRTPASATTDGRPRRFLLAGGNLTVEIDSASVSGLGTASRPASAWVRFAARDLAFAREAPFFVSDVAVQGTRIDYTVHSNPAIQTPAAAGRYETFIGSLHLEIIATQMQFASSPQPRSLVFTLSSPVDPNRNSFLSVVSSKSWGGCLLSNEVELSALLAGAAPSVTAAGVVNAASYAGGAASAGEIVTVFGRGMGPDTLARFTVSGGGIPTILAETRVLFDGVAAPVIYTSSGQLSAIVPYAVAAKTSTKLEVEYKGRKSDAVTLAVTEAAPAIFSLDASGKGQGAILNQDGKVNGASEPAAPESVVVIFATGEGQTDPPGVDGTLAAPPLPKPRLPVAVEIGGLPADVLYAGAAPGLVAGVLQVNAVVPKVVAPGNAVPVVLKVGGAASQSGVTLAVR